MDGSCPENTVDSIFKYKHYTKLSSFLSISIAAVFMLGILAIVNSSWNICSMIGITDLNYNSYNFVRMLFAFITMAFALIAMKLRLITESIEILLMSLLTIIFSITELSLGTSWFSTTNLFFTIGFLTCAGIYFIRKQFSRATATLILSVALLVDVISVSQNSNLYGVLMFLSGMIYIVTASKGLIEYSRGKEVFVYIGDKIRYTKAEYAHILVSTAGILSFAILSLVMGFYVLDTERNVSLYFAKMVLSGVVLLFGTYALSRGVVAEGLMMFLVGLSTFIFSLLHLFHIEGPILLNLIISIFFLPLAYRFFKDKDYMMVITSILLFLVMFLQSFTEMAELLELAITALKIVAAVTAITAWIYYDTGKEFRPKFLRHEHKEDHRSIEDIADDKGFGENQYITITSFLVTALMILWAGITYINMDLVITETNLITYTCTKIIIAAFSMIFTYDSFRKGMLTEGIMTLIITTSAISFSFCYLVYGVSGPASLDVLFSIGLYIAGFIFVVRRDLVLALAAIVMGISMSYSFFYNVDTSLPMGIGLTITGTILAVYALRGLISDNGGMNILHLERRPLNNGFDPSRSSILITTAGYVILSIMALMVCISDKYVTYVVAELFLAGIITIFAVYGLLRNHVAEGLLILLFAIPTMAYSLTDLAGFVTSNVLEIMIYSMGMILAVIFYIKRNYALSVAAIGSGFLLPLGMLLDVEVLWMSGLLIFAAFTLVYSANRWIANEIGIKLIPKML